MENKTRYIFVTGGVVSGLGKGAAAASIGALLQSRGYSVHVRKFDPYLNINAAMSPLQHGEVYVTNDGHETDLDLGYYERFLGIQLSRDDSVSGGRIYWEVLNDQLGGKHAGDTVQTIPHVSNKIMEYIGADAGTDFVICEIGGTVGDIEGLVFQEAARQFALKVGRRNVMFAHLTLATEVMGELKTKPTQQSVRILLEKGIQADMLIIRTPRMLTNEERKKIAMFCNVSPEFVFSGITIDNIYKIPLAYESQGMADRIADHFGLENKKGDLAKFQKISDYLAADNPAVDIALIGNYIVNPDAYKSLSEALFHAGIANNIRVNIRKIAVDECARMSPDEIKNAFDGVSGIIIPDSEYENPDAGKTAAARFARENEIPYLGICAGAVAAADDFVQNVCRYPRNRMPTTSDTKKYRIGGRPCQIIPDTLASKIYKPQTEISERYQCKYDLNPRYSETLRKNGMIISGVSKNGGSPEIIEIPEHPFFVGTMFHPEFSSSPYTSHPLFAAFIKAAQRT